LDDSLYSAGSQDLVPASLRDPKEHLKGFSEEVRIVLVLLHGRDDSRKYSLHWNHQRCFILGWVDDIVSVWGNLGSRRHDGLFPLVELTGWRYKSFLDAERV
jgi:hypothetical protein